MLGTDHSTSANHKGLLGLDLSGNILFALGRKASDDTINNQIAGWSFTHSVLESGNLKLESSGAVRHKDDIWRFNNDGSGQLSDGKIS